MWKEIQKHGLPKKSGIYLTCSVMEGRNMPSDIQDAICYFDVKESQVMQYTGLKDKNGKEIYEGDIVEFSHLGETVIQEVERSIEGYLFNLNDVGVPGSDSAYLHELTVEVIGNIYETPELINK